MAKYNPDFWEIPTEHKHLDRFPGERALWYETEEDAEHREAQAKFRAEVLPLIIPLFKKLTEKQQIILAFYFFEGLRQEEIAAELELTQSTVSRHLFGTVRDGKKVGGAIRKLQRIIHGPKCPPGIQQALATLQETITLRGDGTIPANVMAQLMQKPQRNVRASFLFYVYYIDTVLI